MNESPKIVFYIKEINNLKQCLYKSEFPLTDFKKIRKLFRILDTIEEAFYDIDKKINSQKIEIKEELNEINLNLIISNMHLQIEKVSFKIKKINYEDNYGTKNLKKKMMKKFQIFLLKIIQKKLINY